MAIDRTVFFWKTSTGGQVVNSILVGLFGALLVAVFLTGLLPVGGIFKWAPWILGFNAALTGYTLLDRIGDRLRHPRLAAIGAGGVMAFLFAMLLNVMARHMTGFALVVWTDVIFFTVIGAGLAGIGGVLSIKYRKLGP